MRLSAGTGRWVALLVGAGLFLAGCVGSPAGVYPVQDFQLERYLGTWYSVKRLDHSFERDLTDVTATYRVRDDGRVDVINRGLRPEACEWREATAVARFQGRPEVASLSVTFVWPFAGGYHVIALDHDDYAWALVSGPTRGYLWILARDPLLDQAIIDELVAYAASLGFPADRLMRVSHGDSDCPPPSASG